MAAQLAQSCPMIVGGERRHGLVAGTQCGGHGDVPTAEMAAIGSLKEAAATAAAMALC